MEVYKQLPRMRLINEAYTELKALDERTAVTKYYISQLAKGNKIPCVRAGRKILINFDELLKYLYNTPAVINQ